MPLFKSSILTRQVFYQNKAILAEKWAIYQAHFLNKDIQQNIINSKEEEYQEGFLNDLFVNVLGYTKKPNTNFNLISEQKNETDSKKSDGAILIDNKILGVIELKGTNTIDLTKIESQAFGYKNSHKGCTYVIISNFEKLRLYIDDKTEFIEFNLFQLTEKEFEVLYFCLSYESIKQNKPKITKDNSESDEKLITKKLYSDYSLFKKELFQNLVTLNPQFSALELFNKSQKLLDRFLFIFFAEDRNLLPEESVRGILRQWKDMKNWNYYTPLYEHYKKYFGFLTYGIDNDSLTIFAYNGGLFAADDLLDNVKIDDDLLYRHTKKIAEYNFASEVDVNILGHIFENSLNEIDEIKAQLQGSVLEKSQTKRKKDGVYYTPRYITKYIVEHTIGKSCEEKKQELKFEEFDAILHYSKNTKQVKLAIDKINEYRSWLLQITIIDPACGSGAFLNEALNFLLEEHRAIDELKARLNKETIIFSDIYKDILENNLFGVDINEESVEIAKLSLWLRTAAPNRKLNDLSNNIKCGNSLISDPTVAGDKAFDWQKEFPQVFANGGFDIVIGNPPYGAKLETDIINYYRTNYRSVIGHSEIYYIFIEKSLETILKKENGFIGFIIPNAWFSNKYAKQLRQILISETTINSLINFNQTQIFEDANVETCILILKNKIAEKNHLIQVGHDLENLYPYSQHKWSLNNESIISFASDYKIDLILEKINSIKTHVLSDKLDISNGFKPYQVGYGINLKGESLILDDVNNRIYNSQTKIDSSFKKEIKGKGIKRYNLEWEESYIKWGSWLMSPKNENYFLEPKILLRQVVGNYLFAFLDKEKYYADQSLYICKNYENKSEKLELYLALLNSKLYGFYFRKFYSEEDDLFPKIKVNELKNLPIIEISSADQKNLIQLADNMMVYYRNLGLHSGKFIRAIEREFNLQETSKKMNEWYQLSFGEFIKELEKKKINLSLSKKSEWEDYFSIQKQLALDIIHELTTTDRKIDVIIYALYQLTDEEIELVDSSFE
jgi:type I restriction-modification system DNA methylase subunit